jgi:CubicO group peptidase (beta-lactamase class C family)
MNAFLRAPLLLAVALLAGCDDGLGPMPSLYEVPVVTGDGWSTSHFESAGLDPDSVEAFLSRYEAGEYPNLHAFLLLRHGNLVLEAYQGGTDMFGNPVEYDGETLHPVYSVSKSVTSFLLGSARGMGYPVDPQEDIAGYFPERWPLFQDSGWSEMTLHHLLSMTTGLQWDELSTSYMDPVNDFNIMLGSSEPLEYLFGRPFAATPGESFTYNSGVSVLLGEILQRATGEPADEFAVANLFHEMDIQNFAWRRWGDGTVDTGGGLALRPRDMAKFGELVLTGGRWNGRQVVSSDWVTASTQRQAPDRGYGYQWWVVSLVSESWGSIPAVVAIGWGGQYVIVVPELELICVLTGANLEDLTGQGITVLKETFLSGLLAPH